MQTSAGIAYVSNATGPRADLQWKDGMWDMVSSAKSSNPPLSKEIFLQEHGLSDDH
jgi:hypothetical protein